jgi:hypothetical protein
MCRLLSVTYNEGAANLFPIKRPRRRGGAKRQGHALQLGNCGGKAGSKLPSPYNAQATIEFLSAENLYFEDFGHVNRLKTWVWANADRADEGLLTTSAYLAFQNPKSLERARALRKDDTEAERRLSL